MARLIWVHDDLGDVALNGLAEYQGEEVWFKRQEDGFMLLRLEQETMAKLKSYHRDYVSYLNPNHGNSIHCLKYEVDPMRVEGEKVAVVEKIEGWTEPQPW